MKICGNCGVEKLESEFRVRIEKRASKCKNGLPFQYLNNTCKLCDTILQREYYNKNKTDIFFQEKCRKATKKYYRANKDKRSEYERKRKSTDEWNNYMRVYNKANKETIKKLSSIRNRNYNKRVIEEISDQYIIRLLSHPRVGLKREQVRECPELIEAYKMIIKNKRYAKQQKNERRNVHT